MKNLHIHNLFLGYKNYVNKNIEISAKSFVSERKDEEQHNTYQRETGEQSELEFCCRSSRPVEHLISCFTQNRLCVFDWNLVPFCCVIVLNLLLHKRACY